MLKMLLLQSTFRFYGNNLIELYIFIRLTMSHILCMCLWPALVGHLYIVMSLTDIFTWHTPSALGYLNIIQLSISQ